jgi:hypothetical protein
MNTYIKIVSIFILGLTLTVISYDIMNKGLKNYYVHKYSRVYEMFADSSKYDILFIGSSRTHTTISPLIIDSITGKSSYNTGVDAGGIFDFKSTLDAFLLVHPNPSLVVVTIDPNSFNGESALFDPMQYFPVVTKNKVLENAIAQSGYKTFIIKYIPWLNFIYLDDYTKNIAVSGLRGKKELDKGEYGYKGYRTNSNACIDPVLNRKDSVELKPNPALIKMFQSIIDTCNRRKIKIMLTFAPEYKHEFSGTFKNIGVFNNLIDSLTKINGLKIYREDNLDLNRDSCLFRDIKHLNTPGSILYSRILAERIKNF